MLFCTFVIPLLLDYSTGYSCVLVNSLFCLILPIICHRSVKSPTFFTSFLCFDLSFQTQTPGKVLALPTIEIGRAFPLGMKGLFQRKNNIQPQRQKITVVWKDTSKKWDPFGWVRTWQMPFWDASLPTAVSQASQALPVQWQ